MAATTFQPSAAHPRPPVPPAPVTRMEESSPFQRLGFNFLLVFLFLAFSRILDVKFSFLHITGASYRIVFAMTILSGGFKIALSSRIGRALLGFTIFFGLSVPFSVWRGGSMPVFKDTWLLFSFVAFLATAGLVSNYEQTRKSINTLAWALFAFVIIASVFGTSESGRLILPQGKFANPNEMAQALLIGMPLWIAKLSTTSGIKKLFGLGIIVLMLLTVLRTGSRGALIGFAVMVLLMFLRAGIGAKAQMLIGGVALMAILLGAMPGKIVSRYKTIADDQADDEEMDAAMRESALSSTESRKSLLKNSIKFTLQHPLLGVGPGMFPVAENDLAVSEGRPKGQWLGTHNSYTQVSSELGIPAFCFFLAAIVMALREPYRIYLKTRGDPRTADISHIALGLHYAMVIYAVTILFEHIAYTVMLPVFGGMASALMRTVDAEIERRLASPVPQTITAPHFRTYTTS